MNNDLTPLLDVIYTLTGEHGCPWDKKQTHESLRTDLLEEAYEVVSAIDAKNMSNLQEELGDLLFHIAFQAVLAEKENAFSFSDVADDIVAKMIRRHPHVFADAQVDETDDVLRLWEDIKIAERSAEKPQDILSEIPHGMQDLIRLDKVMRKTMKISTPFDTEQLKEELLKTIYTSPLNYGKILLLLSVLALSDGIHLDQALGKSLATFEDQVEQWQLKSEKNIDFLTILGQKEG